MKDKLSLLWGVLFGAFAISVIRQTWRRMNNFARLFCFVIIPLYHLLAVSIYFIEHIFLTRD